MKKQPVIQCQQLIPGDPAFHYTGEALDMEIFSAELINIIGPNYTGKAHWLKTICGIEDPLSGKVIINGINTSQLSANDWVRIRTKVAYVHADTALLSASNGLLNTLIPALYHQIDKKHGKKPLIEKALDILNEIDPEINLDDLPAYISKEHQYKIAIARALLLQPEVLALNNPYAHFNEDSKKPFASFLESQVKKGLTLIMVTHDIPYAVKNSDRIIFTGKDNIYQFKSTEEILNYRESTVKNFIKKNM